LAAPLSPCIELVGREPAAPRLTGTIRITCEPGGPAKFVIRLDQIRAEGDGSRKEPTRVVEHLSVQVHQPKIEVRVECRLPVIVQLNRAREGLDPLAPDALLETHLAGADPGGRILGITLQNSAAPQQRG